MSKLPLTDVIPVELHRSVFLWPLTLDLALDAVDEAGAIGRAVEGMIGRLLKLKRDSKAIWEKVEDPLDHLAPPPDADAAAILTNRKEAYAEFAYFHDFMQHFLYRKTGGEAGAAFHLFRRSDVKAVEVRFKAGEPVQSYCVRRLNLYVFPLGVAILVLELERELGKEKTCSLSQCMVFNDRFRRSHAPFLDVQTQAPRPGGGPAFFAPDGFVPHEVVWLGAGGHPMASFNTADDVADLPGRLSDLADDARKVPPFRHWRWLINAGLDGGWLFAGTEGEHGESVSMWRHVADDRLPVHVTLGLTDEAAYRAITEGDWMRLAFVDGPDSNAYAYARAFLEKTWADHAYDRFHYAPNENSFEPSRYLLTPYSLIAVGTGWFFNTYIQMHMRRHYFQMMLIATFEQTALLSFSSRITRAVTYLQDGKREQKQEQFEETLIEIERDLLQFVHRFRFTGVSGQLQGMEMLAQLRARKGLDSLYADVKDELQTANSFLTTIAQKRQTEAATRLSVVATLGVLFGLAFSFLGMNVLITKEVLEAMGAWSGGETAGRHMALVSGTVALFLFAGAAFLRVFGGERQPATARRLQGWLLGLAVIFVALSGYLLLGRFEPLVPKPCPPETCVATPAPKAGP